MAGYYVAGGSDLEGFRIAVESGGIPIDLGRRDGANRRSAVRLSRSKRSVVKKRADYIEELREGQRAACLSLLERWLPIAGSEELAVRKKGREGFVIDEAPLESALKAGAYVLKLMERLAKLEGLDASEKRDSTRTEMADPEELERRVEAVRPVLMARMQLDKLPSASRTKGSQEAGEK